MLTKGKGIELLNRALPYPEQMKNIDLEKDGSIYFDWRNSRYKFNLKSCEVDRSNGCILEGDDSSILMTQLLKREAQNVIE